MSATVEDGKIKIKYSIEITREDEAMMEEMKALLEKMQGMAGETMIGEREPISEDQAFQQALDDAVDEAVSEAIDESVGTEEEKKRDLKGFLAEEAGEFGLMAGLLRGGPAAGIMGLAKSIPFIAAIAAAPLLVQFLMKEMTKPGGELDRRFRLIVEEVYNNQRTREHNWAVQKGDKQLIIVSYPVGTGPGHVSNNLEKIRNNPGRVLEHGIDMKAEGMKRTP